MAREETGRSRQVRRAHSVLDATAEWVAKVGIDKTTLEDVARTAGISKSTLYLHWNTREGLMTALLRRERVTLVSDIRDRVAAEGAGAASPASLYRNFMLAVVDRPLLYPDALNPSSEVVRGLVSHKRNRPPADDTLQAEAVRYLADMRDRGLVRTDHSVRELGNTVYSVVAGFLSLRPHVPEPLTLPDEHRADLLADTIDRVLDPGRELSDGEVAERSRLTHQYLERMQHAARHKFDLSLGTETPGTPDDEEPTA